MDDYSEIPAGTHSTPHGDPAETSGIEIVPERPKKGRPLLAWAVILLVVAVPIFAKRELPGEGRGTLRILGFQGKILVGTADVLKANGEELLAEARVLNVGPVMHRLCFVVLAGELGGPKRALEELDALQDRIRKSRVEPDEVETRLVEALTALYGDYRDQKWDAPTLDDAQRELLRAEMDWFGSLALAPAEGRQKQDREAVIAPARRTMFIVFGAMAVVIVLVAGGLIGTGTFAVLLVAGELRANVKPGSPFGGVYAETFAVWMTLFLSLSLAAAVLVRDRYGLAPHLAIFALSMATLAWPMIRGISWHEIRREIGWTGGRNPLVEMGCGLACYVSALPWVGLSLVVSFQLMKLAGAAGGMPGRDDFTSGGGPTHPILDWAAMSGWGGRAMVVVLACVAAPIIEETMFRGVLYRHLREASARWRVSASVAFSVIVNSFLFAAIHPQGLFGIPVLMTLAAAFSLAREWRGSLLGPMTAHAFNNGMATLLLFQVL